MSGPNGLPAFGRAALLLVVDGTLLDFAPTPDAVIVPPGLLDTLRLIKSRLGGALAVISGRPVEQVERFLADAPHAIAGEHGGAIRHGPGEPLERPPLAELPAGWLEEAKRIVAAHPGALLERKARGLVLHYRAVPEAGAVLGDWLRGLAARRPDAFEVLDGNMAFELRPLGADKGRAAAALMARPPFAGRIPVFIGDDVTDLDAIRIAKAMGGEGLFVPDVFGSPAAVRDWLGRVAEQGW